MTIDTRGDITACVHKFLSPNNIVSIVSTLFDIEPEIIRLEPQPLHYSDTEITILVDWRAIDSIGVGVSFTLTDTDTQILILDSGGDIEPDMIAIDSRLAAIL